MTKLKIAFLIGRFQPFHLGHKYLVDLGLEKAEKVVVLVGSSNIARSIKNPWTYAERKEMILAAYPNGNVAVEPCPDVKGNDDIWLSNVHAAVAKHSDTSRVGIIGFAKDQSSYYLKLFPDAVQILATEGYGTLSATHLREAYLKDAPIFPRDLVPTEIYSYLVTFYRTPEFKHLLEEAKWTAAYKESWKNTPFPPQFVTCDAVVTQMGNILLVTRGGHPGKGQLALPGGFVEASKGDSFENVLYELWEEAQVQDERGRIPRGKLRGFYNGKEKRFDDPNRSVRGFTLTTAFRFKFPDAPKLFEVAGGDDAIDAKWYPISYVLENPELMFEDHAHIISEML
jgi:bifunctional NMN adenylyltransferase/nudix hydrolase